MVKSSFLTVIFALLSSVLVAMLIYTWSTGTYFNFNIFWNYFTSSNSFTSRFSAFDSLGQFKEALSSLYNYNVIGFNMNNGDTVLKILKIMANFLPYLGNVISFPIQLLLAVVSLFFELFTYVIDLLEVVIVGFTNSWVPFGSGGFIQPENWFNS